MDFTPHGWTMDELSNSINGSFSICNAARVKEPFFRIRIYLHLYVIHQENMQLLKWKWSQHAFPMYQTYENQCLFSWNKKKTTI